MNGLVLKLAPGERVLVNGAVLENGDRRCRLTLVTPNANVLRLRDAIHPDEANTPVKRVVCIAQLAVAGEADARAILSLSGADGVMIGRAALGAPWLPGEVGAALAGVPARPAPATTAEIGELAAEHLERLLAHAGAPLGIRLFRKHLAAYADHLDGVPGEARRRALTADDPDDEID